MATTSGIDWDAPVSEPSVNPLTSEDFAVPEFKQGTEVSNITNRGEDYSAMGAPPAPSESGIDWGTPVGSGIDWGTPETPPKENQNWLGTGPEMTTEEYFKSGFAGRGIVPALKSDDALMKQADNTIVSKYGAQIKNNPKQYKALWNKEYALLKQQELVKAKEEAKLAPPEPSIGETLTEFGKEAVANPWKTAKSMFYELGKDPEIFFIGGGPSAMRSVVAVGKVAAAKSIAKTGIKGATLGAGLETFASAGDPTGLNLQRIANTGAMFGTLGVGIKATGLAYKGLTGVKDRSVKTTKEFEAELDIAEQEVLKMETESAPKVKEEARVDGEPTLAEPIVETTSNRGHPDLTKENFPELSEITLRDLNKVGTVLNINPKDSSVTLDLGNGEILTIRRGVADAYKSKAEGDRFREPLSNLTRNMNPNSMWSDIDFYNMMRKVQPKETKVKPVAEAPKVSATEQAAKDVEADPTLLNLGDIFKEDTITEQTPVNAVHRILADVALNKRAARLWKESIERMIPNVKVRERITMAIEGAKTRDTLMPDEVKRQTLYGDTAEVAAAKQAKGKFPEIGLTGVLYIYKRALNHLKGGAEFDGFDTFWTGRDGKSGYVARETKKGFPASEGLEAQTKYLEEHTDRLQKSVDYLENLASEENAIKVLPVIKARFAVIGKQAKLEGVFDFLRENYVTHVLDFSKTTLSKASQKSLRDRISGDTKSRFTRDFSLERIYETIRDLEAAVYDAGKELGIDTTGVIVQRDIARIAEVYQESMLGAVLQKRLTNFLEKQIVNFKDGTSLGLLTKDYKEGFRKDYVKFTSEAAGFLKDYMVHPDLVDVLSHIVRQTDPGLIVKSMGLVSMLSKTITTMASLFHATSLGVARATATPFGMIKEFKSGFSGTKAALETLRHDGLSKDVENWKRAGLKMETEDIKQGIVGDIAKSTDDLLNRFTTKKDLKITRILADKAEADLLQPLNRFTWDFMHSAGKFATAQYLFAKIKARNPLMEDQVIRSEVSNFVNKSFGGLDWIKIASDIQNPILRKYAMKATSLSGRAWMQIVAFAPDWTISTLSSFTGALPKQLFSPSRWEIKKGAKGFINPITSGDLSRRYVATTALYWATILNGINLATSGHYMWENEDPTRIDLGDGSTMQAAKHSMEGPHWALHPLKTGFNKLGYFPKTIAELGSNYVQGPVDVLKTVTKPFVPFQVTAAFDAPSGEKIKYGAASFFGTPIYGAASPQFREAEDVAKDRIKRRETLNKNKLEKAERLSIPDRREAMGNSIRGLFPEYLRN